MTNRTPWGFANNHRRAYSIWCGMVARCTNENHDGFANYGGRGIQVCERWRSFIFFIEDMGDPQDSDTLDRIDSNGDYEPSNCRWATRRQQSLNTRRSRVLHFRGRSQTAHEWAEELGIKPKTLRKRLYDGWSVDRALTEPLRKAA